MSIHTALLVFKPWPDTIGDDGLYPFRYTVTATNIGLPIIMASVAFAHHGHGYSAQLPICTLPVRPFWYRLALQWVPRYIIWFIVFGLAISVYCYVGKEFRMFSAGAVSSSPAVTTSHSNVVSHKPAGGDGSATDTGLSTHEAVTAKRLPNTWPPSRRRSSPFSSTTLAAVNEELAPDHVAESFQSVDTQGEFKDAKVEKNKVSDGNIETQPDKDVDADRRSSTLSTSRTLSAGDGFMERPRRPSLSPQNSPRNQAKPIEVVIDPPTQFDESDKPYKPFSVNPAVAKRRRAIVQQLRLLFIYPILYILLWFIPFVSHCYQYSDYYALHPPFTLLLLSYFCLAIMGAVNGVVFSFKERPWRHISGSDGTFLGSFCWWRTKEVDSATAGGVPRGESVLASALASLTGARSTAGFEHRRSTDTQSSLVMQDQTSPPKSGVEPLSLSVSPGRTPHPGRQRRSEAERRHANLAYERLAAEIADRQNGHGTDMLGSSHHQGARRPSITQRPASNWWDRRVSAMSIEEEVEGEVQAERNGVIKSESVEQEQRRRYSTGDIVGSTE